MGKAATRGQALELTARFAINTRWDELDAETVQRIVDLPTQELGRRFTEFLGGMYPMLLLKTGRLRFLDDNFAVSEHFKVNTGDYCPIGRIDERFEELFGKVVESVGFANQGSDIEVYRLLSAPHGKPLTEEIRYLKKSPVRFSTIWQMMTQSPRGKKFNAHLDTDEGNIFYVSDINGEQWYLGVHWNSIQHYWQLYMKTLTSGERFRKKSQLFCAA